MGCEHGNGANIVQTGSQSCCLDERLQSIQIFHLLRNFEWLARIYVTGRYKVLKLQDVQLMRDTRIHVTWAWDASISMRNEIQMLIKVSCFVVDPHSISAVIF